MTLSRRLLHTREVHPNSAATADVLDRAAHVIESHGLAQSCYFADRLSGDPITFWVPGHPVDLAGAISIALGTPTVHGAMRVTSHGGMLGDPHPAYRTLADHLGVTVDGIFEWIDHVGRTAEEAAQALRDCATQVRERAA
jgi:hypothetical protein